MKTHARPSVNLAQRFSKRRKWFMLLKVIRCGGNRLERILAARNLAGNKAARLRSSSAASGRFASPDRLGLLCRRFLGGLRGRHRQEPLAHCAKLVAKL